MCRHEHELCKHDLRGLSKYEVNQHYFEFIRNATKEEYKANDWVIKHTRGLYKCRICGDINFYGNGGFKTSLKVCKNGCNGNYYGQSSATVIGYNNIGITHSNLAKYFCNINDVYMYKSGSNKEVELKCPKCKLSKTMTISTLTKLKEGFPCDCLKFNKKYSSNKETEVFKINWDDIEEVKNERDDYIPKKIFLEHLPIYRGGIYWKKTVGMKVPILYNNKEYIISIDGYNANKRHIIINILGFYKIDFSIYTSSFLVCQLGGLINNIYANPNIPNRQLIIDSIGEEETKKLLALTHKKIDITCPDCGCKGSIDLDNLYFRGFSCPYCSDGYSYPEKLMALVLKKLGVEFTRQLPYNNGEYKYDFYIASWKAIFETHGDQHYRGWGGDKDDLLRQETTDKNKRYNAIYSLNLGIRNEDYHEVDCRYSTLEWCRPNIEKALSKYIDTSILTDEDWKEFDKQAQKSLMIKVCQYYNTNKIGVSEISIKFGISKPTIRKYLHKGTDLGLCKYEPNNSATRFVPKGYVIALKDGQIIYKEESSQELGKIISPNSPNKVNACCNYYHNPIEYLKTHKQATKTVKGYICMYEEDYINKLKGGDLNV